LATKDTLGHQRPTYENPEVMETLDMTRFLFGLPDGSMIQTGEMKISSHEKSRLIGFLTGWLAGPPVMDGSWDYVVMVGKGAMITIVHKVSQKGRTYADIAAVSPVMDQLVAQVPQMASFQIPAASAEVPAAQPAPVQQVQQAAPVQQVQPAPQVQPQVQTQQTAPGFTQVQQPPF
jgi:predicted component of type VI protein secretion system